MAFLFRISPDLWFRMLSDFRDGLLLLASQTLFLAWGNVFATRTLLQGYSDWRVQLVFALLFSSSCVMYELIIFEITDILTARCFSPLHKMTDKCSSRWIFWIFNFHLTILLLLLIIPYLQVYLLCIHDHGGIHLIELVSELMVESIEFFKKRRHQIATVSLMGMLYVFARMADWFPIEQPASGVGAVFTGFSL